MSGIPAGAGSLLGKRLGKYEILALLALGGTAEIYLARIGGAAGFEKYVVVKCLHDHLADDTEFVKMFLDEARLAAHLDHSNIVQTMELGEHEHRYYMVMEFLAGLSLAMIVRRAGERLQGGKIPIPLVLNALAQACAGLHYAHEKMMNGKPLNIVHRDISPQNLVVSFEGVVKVVDFGIAKAELRETRTRSGTIKGKFAYMSPEQCVANNVDRRTDVFALGVIAHELLTGRRLFKKPSPYETYQAVIECAVEAPSKLNVEVDAALDPLILKAVAKDKEQRYQTAEAFGDALLGYLHHRGKGSGPGDVARFFEASFSQEIDEHGARMRELISGREFASDTGVNWGEDDDEAKRNMTVDLGAKAENSVSLDSIDIVESDRPSSGSLSDVIDDLGGGRGDEDDDMPAEKTRIETNPLERLEELDKVVANKGKTPAPAMIPTRIAPASPKAAMPPSGALPLPPAPTGPMPAAGSISPKVPSEKFPELANLPTMIADLDEDSASAQVDGALAKTEMRPDGNVDPHGPTRMSGDMVDPNRPTANGVPAQQQPRTASQPVQRPPAQTGPQPLRQPAQTGPQPLRPPAQTGPQPQPPRVPMNPSQPPPMQPQRPTPSQPPPNVANMGYPVLNAQLSAQIATGATVFPSESPHGGRPPQQQPPPYGGPPQQQPPSPTQPPYGGPQQQPPYGQQPYGQQPYGQQQPPHGGPPHGGQQPPQFAPPMGTPGGQPPMHDSGPYHPQQMAQMASPVGQNYGQNVDWAAAAAAPTKALPTWKLIVIFAGALGLALLITILIAKAAR